MFRERMRNMPEEIRQRRFRNIGDPRRRDRFISTYELGVHSPFVIHGIAAYERAFKMLEDTLAETGPWIVGANASLADISLMPFAARLDYLGLLDLWIEDRPRLGGPWLANGRASKRACKLSSRKRNFRKCDYTGRRSLMTSPGSSR
jgi:glutathione S-transferase